jgi:hypothetical protein
LGSISKAAFRRIYVLYLLGQFPAGSYGAKRLQKLAYLPERHAKVRPFSFVRHHFGQFSEELDDTKDQLITMGYVAALPLDTARVTTLTIGDNKYELMEGGNRFFLRGTDNLAAVGRALRAADPTLPGLIQNAVQTYGFKREQEIIDYCYGLPEFQDKALGELVLGANVEERIQLDLSDDECDDLELSMTPQFVVAMADIAKAMESSTLDFEKVKQVDFLPVPST